MPRLSWYLFKVARNENPLLTLLLPGCRDLPSSRNELRWLRDHAIAAARRPGRRPLFGWRAILQRSCRLRGRGKPLQYIIGDQPFGNLDILCRPGVLIPRPETEAYTTHVAESVLRSQSYGNEQTGPALQSLRILDLCTGTGCIPLLLHSLLSTCIKQLRCIGVDISPAAITLANRNLQKNVQQGTLRSGARDEISFISADVLDHSQSAESNREITHQSIRRALEKIDEAMTFDILVSNPPYISSQGLFISTSRSVRNWEPKLALVPSPVSADSGTQPDTSFEIFSVATEDSFYPHLLAIAGEVKAKLLLLEVSDITQAIRVVSMARRSGIWQGVEIWRDWLKPTIGEGIAGEHEAVQVEGKSTPVRGQGNGRTVVCWRGIGGCWIGGR